MIQFIEFSPLSALYFLCRSCHERTPQLPKFLPTLGEVAGKVFPSSKLFSQKQKRSPKMNALKLLSLLTIAFFIFSCSNPTTSDFNAKTTDEDTPEALVIDALKNFEEVHEWIIAGKPFGKSNALLKVDQINADSTWIYGDTLTGGVGVVITEKHSYPKGLLLITKELQIRRLCKLDNRINQRKIYFLVPIQQRDARNENKNRTNL
jgi:hypothetical protein